MDGGATWSKVSDVWWARCSSITPSTRGWATSATTVLSWSSASTRPSRPFGCSSDSIRFGCFMAISVHLLSPDLSADPGESVATPRLRDMIPASSRKIIAGRLKAMQSFTFITCDRGGKIDTVRFGAPVTQLCHYRMVTGPETRYYSFWLTPQGMVADFRSSTE